MWVCPFGGELVSWERRPGGWRGREREVGVEGSGHPRHLPPRREKQGKGGGGGGKGYGVAEGSLYGAVEGSGLSLSLCLRGGGVVSVVPGYNKRHLSGPLRSPNFPVAPSAAAAPGLPAQNKELSSSDYLCC